MKHKKRPVAEIVSRRVVGSPCPKCTTVLTGVTGAHLFGFFEKPLKLKGHVTMCAYCGALLIFADDAGRLRAMTEQERNSIRFAPKCEELLAMFRAANAEQMARFTQRIYNVGNN